MAQRNSDLITDIELLVFRLNGRLLKAGDRKVAALGLTSARWQMLGALHFAEGPCTAPQLAEAMGVTRQGAQKQLNRLVSDGLVETRTNPRHARSPYYGMTATGRRVYARTESLQDEWAGELAVGLDADDLRVTREVLRRLEARLAEPGSRAKG